MPEVFHVIRKAYAAFFAAAGLTGIFSVKSLENSDHLRRDIGIDDVHCRRCETCHDQLQVEIRRLRGRL